MSALHRKITAAQVQSAVQNTTPTALTLRMNCLPAVSYTHLDVYKRQIYNLGILSLTDSATWFANAILIIVALPLGLILSLIHI